MTTSADRAWLDQHYPRCTRCGLRTYVHNLAGVRVDEITSSPNCPAYREAEADRPVYPYVGSRHVVASVAPQTGVIACDADLVQYLVLDPSVGEAI